MPKKLTMNDKKHKQTIIPKAELPEEWRMVKLQQLRVLIFTFIKNNFSGMVVENLDTSLPIIVSVTSARKTAFGEAIYFGLMDKK